MIHKIHMKKAVALLLTVFMLISILPLSVFAQTSGSKIKVRAIRTTGEVSKHESMHQLFDGNRSATKWCQASTTGWVVFDAKVPVILEKMTAFHAGQSAEIWDRENAGNTKAYKLEALMTTGELIENQLWNPSLWQTVAEVQNNTQAITETEIHMTTSARYFRISVQDSGDPGQNKAIRFYELELYGHPELKDEISITLENPHTKETIQYKWNQNQEFPMPSCPFSAPADCEFDAWLDIDSGYQYVTGEPANFKANATLQPMFRASEKEITGVECIGVSGQKAGNTGGAQLLDGDTQGTKWSVDGNSGWVILKTPAPVNIDAMEVYHARQSVNGKEGTNTKSYELQRYRGSGTPYEEDFRDDSKWRTIAEEHDNHNALQYSSTKYALIPDNITQESMERYILADFFRNFPCQYYRFRVLDSGKTEQQDINIYEIKLKGRGNRVFLSNGSPNTVEWSDDRMYTLPTEIVQRTYQKKPNQQIVGWQMPDGSVQKPNARVYFQEDASIRPLFDEIPQQVQNIKVLASSGKVNAAEAPEKAFDGSMDTKWCDTGSMQKSFFIAFETETPIQVRDLHVYHAQTKEPQEENTKHFTLEVLKDEAAYAAAGDKTAYLSDNANWEQIAQVGNNLANTTKIKIATNQKAKIYRFHVLDTGETGETVATRIYEIQLFKAKEQEISSPVTLRFAESKNSPNAVTVTVQKDAPYLLPDYPFILPKDTLFFGWELPNQIGKNLNAAILPQEDMTLTPILFSIADYAAGPWYTYQFDANGGSGSMDAQKVSVSCPNLFLPECALTAPKGSIFTGWILPDGSVHYPGEQMLLTGNTTLRPRWSSISYHHIMLDSGYSFAEQDYLAFTDQLAKLFPVPMANIFNAPPDKDFYGWHLNNRLVFRAEDGLIPYDELMNSFSLEAVWEPKRNVHECNDVQILASSNIENPQIVFDKDNYNVWKPQNDEPMWIVFKTASPMSLTSYTAHYQIHRYAPAGVPEVQIMTLKDVNAYQNAADKDAYLREDNNWKPIHEGVYENSGYTENNIFITEFYTIRSEAGQIYKAKADDSVSALQELHIFGVDCSETAMVREKDANNQEVLYQYAKPAGTTFVLPNPDRHAVPEGMQFAGWQVDGLGPYPADSEIFLPSDSLYYPLFETKDVHIHLKESKDSSNIQTKVFKYDEPFTMPECPFQTDASKRFIKWQLEDSEKSLSLFAKEQFVTQKDLTFYAVYADKADAEIHFQQNGGYGSMDTEYVPKTEAYTLPDSTFIAPKNKHFEKWNIGKSGETITPNAQQVLEAQWADGVELVSSGNTAETKWYLTSDGYFQIDTKGYLEDFSKMDTLLEYNKRIRYITVSPGVDYMRPYTFYLMTYAKYLYLPDSMAGYSYYWGITNETMVLYPPNIFWAADIPQAQSKAMLGDIDADEMVKLSDYTAVFKEIQGVNELGFTEQQNIVADCNGDGAVDAFDLAILSHWIEA